MIRSGLRYLPFMIFFCSTATPSVGHCLDSFLTIEACDRNYSCNPHICYLGPEVYEVKRSRQGGTKQLGEIYGVRAGYDYIKRYSLYLGIEGSYGQGKIHGNNSGGTEIKSKFTDETIEGRIGYTIQQKRGNRFSITPFVGAGYIRETNQFVEPSPLKIKSEIGFKYGVAGFLSKVCFSNNVSAGLNFKIRYLIEARNWISNDPDHESSSMLIKEEYQYRLDLPFIYEYSERFRFAIVPFYEYRHYGRQANYPFDFLETRLKMYGATFKVMYSFGRIFK